MSGPRTSNRGFSRSKVAAELDYRTAASTTGRSGALLRSAVQADPAHDRPQGWAPNKRSQSSKLDFRLESEVKDPKIVRDLFFAEPAFDFESVAGLKEPFKVPLQWFLEISVLLDFEVPFPCREVLIAHVV